MIILDWRYFCRRYLFDAYKIFEENILIRGSSNIEMGKKWYENIIFSFIYAIISMKVIY